MIPNQPQQQYNHQPQQQYNNRNQTPQYTQQNVIIAPPSHQHNGYNGYRANSSRSSSSAFVVVAVCLSCCLFFLGATFRTMGIALSNIVDDMDPDLHFNNLGTNSCFIENIYVQSQTIESQQSSDENGRRGSRSQNSQVTRYSCEDRFQYSLIKSADLPFLFLQEHAKTNVTIVGNATHAMTKQRNTTTLVYLTHPDVDIVQRGQGTCASNALKQSTPTYTNHSYVECWEASQLMPDDIPILYFCYNPSCLKIFTPYTKAMYEKQGVAMESTGTVLIVLGILFGLCAVALVYLLQSKNKNSVTPTMTTNQQSGQLQMVPLPYQQHQQQHQPASLIQPYQQPLPLQPMVPPIQPIQPLQPTFGIQNQFQQQQQQQQFVPQLQPQVVPQQQQQLMMVTCPPGSLPSQTILVNTPQGQTMQVMIPPNVMPGGQFQVAY